jgi:hypothetical protein
LVYGEENAELCSRHFLLIARKEVWFEAVKNLGVYQGVRIKVGNQKQWVGMLQYLCKLYGLL